jgi:4-hydroxy-2-oxoheptanedioate aldolase
MPAAELKARWKNGEVTYATCIRLGPSLVAEVFAQKGFDVVWIDQQHGFISDSELVPILQAMNGTSATSLVRVPANDDTLIGRVLDAGAEGVIIPMVENVEDAERAVAACRHGPVGVRSIGALRLSYLPGGPGRETICLVMVETREGVDNVDAIVRVPGVDGVFVGPNDLSLSLGLPRYKGIGPGAHGEAIERIRQACDAAGIVCGISGDAKEMRGLGFRLISLGGDSMFLFGAMDAALKQRF